MYKKALYLSGAPRVTLRSEAENIAARSHILGVINGFNNEGFKVDKYIVGDKLPSFFSNEGSENITRKNNVSRISADIIRIGLRYLSRGGLRFNKNINKYDLVYERFALMQSLGKFFKKKYGVLWILETNAILSSEASKESNTLFFNNVSYKFEKKAYEDCDYLVCVTNALKDQIVDEFGISSEKIIVMRNGVDVKKFIPKNSSDFNDKDFVIGYLGSITSWSCLEILIQALYQIKNNFKQNIKLEIIGDGPLKNDLEKLVNDKSLQNNVEIFGRIEQEQVPEYAKNFSIAYCNSVHGSLGKKTYGSPMKLYEYMAMGIPVLGGKFEDTELLVKENETGFLFDWNDENDLVRVIMNAIQEKERLHEMGMNARSSIEQNHSWEARVGDLIKEINDREKTKI
jgi:glycosyltransferase involved in cell wall biosynthesis